MKEGQLVTKEQLKEAGWEYVSESILGKTWFKRTEGWLIWRPYSGIILEIYGGE